MIKLLTVIILLLSCFSCLDIDMAPHERALYRIVNKQDSKFRKKGFIPIGRGGRFYPIVDTIYMAYITTKYRFKTIDEVRSFFVPLFEEYLQPLNDEASIRPYLQNYPLDARHLELAIRFAEADDSHVQLPWISNVSTTKYGDIVYMVQEPNKQGRTVIHRETFEEAKRILAQQNMKHE